MIALLCLAAVWYLNKMAIRLLGENSIELSLKEYSLLKDLEEAGFKWISRDYNGRLHAFTVRPRRVSKMGIFYVWKKPQNLQVEAKAATLRKEYFLQVGRFKRNPYQISDILYLEEKRK